MPSCTFEIKCGWIIVCHNHKRNLTNTVEAIILGARAWREQPIDRIRLDLSDWSSSPVGAKVECCKSLDHSFAWSKTAQPPVSHPQALSVVTNGQQVVLFVSEGVNPLPTCRRRFYGCNREDEPNSTHRECSSRVLFNHMYQ